MRWAGHVARFGDVRTAYSSVTGNSEAKQPLWRPGCRWKISMKIEINLKFIHLAQDRDQWLVLVNVVMNLRVP
jgi:hypothetical protein